MIALDALLERVGGVERREIEGWVASGWVRPENGAEGWRFHEVDVARIRLIVEIRRDLGIEEEAVSVILSLLDQLYGLRRGVQLLAGAIARQPEPVRAAIAAALADQPDG